MDFLSWWEYHVLNLTNPITEFYTNNEQVMDRTCFQHFINLAICTIKKVIYILVESCYNELSYFLPKIFGKL